MSKLYSPKDFQYSLFLCLVIHIQKGLFCYILRPTLTSRYGASCSGPLSVALIIEVQHLKNLLTHYIFVVECAGKIKDKNGQLKL